MEKIFLNKKKSLFQLVPKTKGTWSAYCT